MRRRLLAKLRGHATVESLVARGLRLGRGAFVADGVYLDPGRPWLISIGDDSMLGPRAMVLVHDASTKLPTGYTRIAPVVIGARVFVGAGAIVLPGSTIGDGAIIGAGAVIRGDVPAGAIAIGNPSQIVGSTTDFAAKHRRRLAAVPTWPAGAPASDAAAAAAGAAQLAALRSAGGEGYLETATGARTGPELAEPGGRSKQRFQRDASR